MTNSFTSIIKSMTALLIVTGTSVSQEYQRIDEYSGNPLFEHIFTADPSALVYRDTMYIFTGHDEQAEGVDGFVMDDWHVFSSPDMLNWEDHGEVLTIHDFSWSSGAAFAGHCVYNNGKFFWYVPMVHNTIRQGEGFAIGVAVSDHPAGPYEDAAGRALITDNTANSIELNIDPAVYVDDDGQVYLYWGSWGECRYVRLKDNMTELDGDVHTVNTTGFFEAPYIHKYNDTYYLSYATGYPSQIAYATSSSPAGPWDYQGVINDYVESSETNHQAIVEFKNQWYFVYHNGALPDGGIYRRSVCVDTMGYNPDGSIKPVIQTTEGVRGIETAEQEDCAGVMGGAAYIDSCGECVGGTTGNEPCEQDCSGDWGGDAYQDNCGICVGGNTGTQPCTGSLQGEDAYEYEGVFESDNSGYIGDGYLNMTNESGVSASWRICSDTSIIAEIALRYSNGSGASRNISAMVNGSEQIQELTVPATPSWTDWETVTAELMFSEGENRITITALSDKGGPNIDVIAFSDSNLYECQTGIEPRNSLESLRRKGMGYSDGILKFYLKRDSYVSIDMYNLSGRKVKKVFRGRLGHGVNSKRLVDSGLNPGMYMLMLETDYNVSKRKILRVE